MCRCRVPDPLTSDVGLLRELVEAQLLLKIGH